MDEVGKVFLTEVSSVVPADSVGMYRLEGESGGVLDIRTDAGSAFLAEYEDYGRDDDPVLDFVLRERRPIDSTRVVSEPLWENCGARTALGGAGFAHSLEAPLCASSMFLGTINFARTASAPPFGSDDLASARLISEQLGLATERALRFELAGERATMMESALDRLPQAMIVTDLDARVLFRNRAARKGPGMLGPAEGTHDAVADSIAEAMEEFRVNGKRVHVSNIGAAGTDSHKIVKGFRLGEHPRAAVTLVFDCGAARNTHALPVWEVLSRREHDIAQLVSEGLTTKQIADRAFISENTVKQHLKRVFAKTNVRNRAELIQLIWAAGAAGGHETSTGHQSGQE